MRKIFTLFAAMLVALTVSASKVQVSTSSYSKDVIRQALAAAATAGTDTIEVAAGFYDESNNNYIAFTHEVVLMAAEGAEVIIQPRVPITIKGKAEIKNIKIKCDSLNSKSRYEHLIYPANALAGNELRIDGCEFYNDTCNSALIHCYSTQKFDSVIVKNCKFHDITKSCMFFDGNSINGLKVTNSTFYNITTNTSKYWAGIIDERNADAEVLVDHCTFYDCMPMSSDYGAIGKIFSTKAVVSNCIFAMSSSTANTRTIWAGDGTHLKARNCLVYNYTYDDGYAMRSTVDKIQCMKDADPKFKDAANGDFTLTAGSRALEYAGKAVDGTTDSILNLGDPRWVPEPKTLYCEMTQSWWTDAGAAVGCYAWNGADANKVENAAWPGVRMTPVVNENGVWTIQLSRKYDNIIFTRMNPSDEGTQDWGYKSYDLTIPEQWDYYTITAASAPGDKKAAGTWKKRNPILENGWYLVGTFDGVEEKTFETLTAEKLFTVNPENENEYIVTANLTEGDKFKAAYVYYDQINDYKPNGVGDEYVIDEWHTGVKTIVFNQTYQEAWGGYFYITPNEPVFTYSDFEIDLRNGQLGTEGNNMQKYLKVADPYVYYDQQPVESNARLNAARFNSTADPSHGYVNFVATIPVVAGNYKITVGNCTYNNTNGAVKNADGTETLDLIDKNGQTITAIETPKNCYHQNTTENVTSVWFVAEADQTIQIVCPQYAPYIKVEQVAEVPEEVIVYNVTFANAEGATGVLPANLENIAPTTEITLPKNTSMYKEGYTFVGWTDGEDVYNPGFEYEVTDDVTFTAVYAENTVSLADRTAAVTIKWEFSQSKGVAPINVSGATTFVVAQATIGEEKIDVKLPIDATEGKFVNGANIWTQINPGVIFSIPSAKDAVITYKQYDNGVVTTPEINVSATDATYQLVAEGTSGNLYYEYVQVVLPEPTATGIDNTVAGEKAVKKLENGMLVIEKNGKTYNVLGTVVK